MNTAIILSECVIVRRTFSRNASFALTACALSLFLLVLAAPLALGDTWDGGGEDDNFGTGANWVDNTAPSPSASTDLFFAGSTRLAPNNNYTGFDRFRSWYFNIGAGSFNISGNAIDLGFKIENNSTALQTVSIAAIASAGDFLEMNPVSGDLNINVADIFLNGDQLRIYGDAAKTITFENSVISNGSFALNGDSTAHFKSVMTYSGSTSVNAGVLNLDSSSGAAAGSTTSVSVASGAKLLISQSGQVNNDAAVSLSGGTIQRASGVDEEFGALSIDSNSTLNFGDGTAGNLTFGVYEAGSQPTHKLTVNNFFSANTLVFGSDLSSYISSSYSGTSFTSTYFDINSTSGGFTSNWNGSTFTITAIPEPSTYLAAAGLFALFLWPMRRRLLKDAKFLLALRPTGRA